MSPKTIAIIGAGPVGLEAALYGAQLGHRVRVFELGRVGESMRRWGHVTLFSTSAMNCSILARAQIEAAGVEPPGAQDYVTGIEHVERCLEPLARSAPLDGTVHEHTRVLQVGRQGIGKPDLLGGGRERHPFRLLLETPEGEKAETADVVIDCSGTFGNPDWMGDGNIPAVGELGLRGRIAYTLQDIAGEASRHYRGKRILLVGAGLSAATALDALLRLPGTHVLWVSRQDRQVPYTMIPDDPLPQRARLCRLGNDVAAGSGSRVELSRGTAVEAVVERDRGFEVTLRSRDRLRTAAVDRILAHVGFSPDNSIYRELQVHECYATFGPINLAAGLLARGAGDCLAQPSQGPAVLCNPEPDFYVLGAKSYGKNSSFLIRVGLEQVRNVFTLIEGRPELDLYAA